MQEFTLFVFSKIVVVPDFYLSIASKEKAYLLCKDIDAKDTLYVALAIELNMQLITRDKALCNGLIAKGFSNIILFDELIETLEKA